MQIDHLIHDEFLCSNSDFFAVTRNMNTWLRFPGEDLVSAGTRLYVIKKCLLKKDHILAIKASARFLMLRQAVKVWLQVRTQVVQIDCMQGTQENSP